MRNAVFLAVSLSVPFPALPALVLADVVFDNFGPGDSYQTDQGYGIGTVPPVPDADLAPGEGFRVSRGTFQLTSIELALSFFKGSVNAVDVQFRADDGGVPGAILESFHFTDLEPFGIDHPLVVAESVLQPLLEEKATYWVTASASEHTLAVWNKNSTDEVGQHAISMNGTPFVVYKGLQGAFRVNGDPVLSR
jgi:hypothetical protein